MTKLTLAAVLVGVFLFVTSCASMNEAPTVIYPDPIKNSGAYKLDTTGGI